MPAPQIGIAPMTAAERCSAPRHGQDGGRRRSLRSSICRTNTAPGSTLSLADAARLVGAHVTLSVTLLFQRKLEPALAHSRRGFEMFDPKMQFPDWPGAHPAVLCQLYLALISWVLGYSDRSLEELRAAVRSTETLGHPLTLAQTLYYAAVIHIFRHEPSAAGDYAGRALRICEEDASRTGTRFPFV